MTKLLRAFTFSAALLVGSGAVLPALAQQPIAFGGLRQDTTLPVSVNADQFSINNADGTAVFSGEVVVLQGEMRMSAAEVRVEYGQDGRGISRLHASGGVIIASPTDAAEAQEAVYTIDSGIVVLSKDVVLTQGQNAMSGQKLTINLKSGTGTMEGRVSTTFTPGKK